MTNDESSGGGLGELGHGTGGPAVVTDGRGVPGHLAVRSRIHVDDARGVTGPPGSLLRLVGPRLRGVFVRGRLGDAHGPGPTGRPLVASWGWRRVIKKSTMPQTRTVHCIYLCMYVNTSWDYHIASHHSYVRRTAARVFCMNS